MAVRQDRRSLAQRCTYLLEPKNWLIVTVILIVKDLHSLRGGLAYAALVL